MLGNESGLERPQLGQLLDVLIPSDRIKVFDGASEKDPVLFTGFAAIKHIICIVGACKQSGRRSGNVQPLPISAGKQQL